MTRMSLGPRYEARAAGDEELIFREAGSPTIHSGSVLRLESDQVRFETSYGVAPGSRLNVTMTALDRDETQREVAMEVLSVDTRPSGDFAVVGRLQHNR